MMIPAHLRDGILLDLLELVFFINETRLCCAESFSVVTKKGGYDEPVILIT